MRKNFMEYVHVSLNLNRAPIEKYLWTHIQTYTHNIFKSFLKDNTSNQQTPFVICYTYAQKCLK